MEIVVIGVGFVGVEVVNVIVKFGIKVKFFEMKLKKFLLVYKIDIFVEFVCSNFLKFKFLINVFGFLKEEMKVFGLFVMEVVEVILVEVGQVLVVDRYKFLEYIIQKIR